MPSERDPLSKLTCDCRSTYFLPRVHLIRASGGGITPEPAGYICRQCNADIDPGRLAQRQDLERKRRELAEQQAALDAEEAPPGRPKAAVRG